MFLQNLVDFPEPINQVYAITQRGDLTVLLFQSPTGPITGRFVVMRHLPNGEIQYGTPQATGLSWGGYFLYDDVFIAADNSGEEYYLYSHKIDLVTLDVTVIATLVTPEPTWDSMNMPIVNPVTHEVSFFYWRTYPSNLAGSYKSFVSPDGSLGAFEEEWSSTAGIEAGDDTVRMGPELVVDTGGIYPYDQTNVAFYDLTTGEIQPGGTVGPSPEMPAGYSWGIPGYIGTDDGFAGSALIKELHYQFSPTTIIHYAAVAIARDGDNVAITAAYDVELPPSGQYLDLNEVRWLSDGKTILSLQAYDPGTATTTDILRYDVFGTIEEFVVDVPGYVSTGSATLGRRGDGGWFFVMRDDGGGAPTSSKLLVFYPGDAILDILAAPARLYPRDDSGQAHSARRYPPPRSTQASARRAGSYH